MAVTRIAGGGVGLWLLLVAAPAVADSKEAHKLGVEAIEAGRWADAERFFRAAIDERSQEKYNRLLKSGYLPHYYLGVALAEQGDCRSALASWEESRRQGQIAKAKLDGDLDRRQQRCRTHLRQVDAAIAEVEELLARSVEARDSLAALARSSGLAPIWDEGEPSLGALQEAAAARLAAARRSFEEGSAAADLDLLDTAKTLAGRAVGELRAAADAARKRLGELDAAIASALETLESAEQEGRRTLRSVGDLAPFPRRLGARVAKVQRVLQEITDNKSEAGAQVLADLTRELTAAVTALQRAARRPPAQLRLATEAFLNGAYEEAIGLLEDERLAANARARPHVCLLRAASRHALWVLGGESDGELIDLATRDLTDCGDAGPAALGTRFFSPPFVEFHDATLRAPAEEAPALSGDDAEAAGTAPAETADGR